MFSFAPLLVNVQEEAARTKAGEVREEDEFLRPGEKASDEGGADDENDRHTRGGSDRDKYSQDSGGEVGGAQFKTATKKGRD